MRGGDRGGGIPPRTRNFTIITVYTAIFVQLTVAIHFL